MCKAQTQTPGIIVTMGDPLGIGPELCLKILNDKKWVGNSGAAITICGSLRLLDELASSKDIKIKPECVKTPVSEKGRIAVLDMDVIDPGPVKEPAVPTPEGGKASVKFIERAVREVMSGRADAIATGPISKEALKLAGCKHPGHTEMLGELCGAHRRPVMMMLSDPLRVAFVTTHLAVKNIPGSLTTGKIFHAARTFAEALEKYFGKNSQDIALCALNPHAGDGGRFGDEERMILKPAIDKLHQSGIGIQGPLPADTLFYKAAQGMYSGVVAIYHDQGMIPVKMLGLGKAVNVTLGLPLIRTSPAHGTAYDIAGQYKADPESMKNAIRTALNMVAAGP